MSEKQEAIEKFETGMEIKNLIVASLPVRDVLIGDTESVLRLVQENQKVIQSIFWSESGISIQTNGNENIIFQPEFDNSSALFFERETKRRGGYGEDADTRVWEGEYAPVQFSKQMLIKFLKKYASYFDDEVTEAIKSLKVTERSDSATEMISLDGDHERETIETQETTNLPKTFTANMPLFDGVEVELHFEASVKQKTDDYGNKGKQKIIEIRCTNAREAVRDVFKGIMSQLPEDIPKYYGKTMLRHEKR
jgi:hypothetical protein